MQNPQLLPEIRLHLASEAMALWRMSEEERAMAGLPLPYWAFAWAGGQALARYLLDRPAVAAGKRVLDVGAGSGIEAIAAALAAAAAAVTAVDTDPFAIAAIGMNAKLNQVAINTCQDDAVDQAGDQTCAWDLVLVGDLFFEQPLAGKLENWLRGLAEQGVEILIGDPQRTYLPRRGLEKLATHAVPTTSAMEDSDLRNASVWRMTND